MNILQHVKLYHSVACVPWSRAVTMLLESFVRFDFFMCNNRLTPSDDFSPNIDIRVGPMTCISFCS